MMTLAAAAGQRRGKRRLGIEALAPLVERGDLQIGAEPDVAAVRSQRAGEHIDQRGLAGAVRPDDADPVAACDLDAEIAHHEVAIALGDAGASITILPVSFASCTVT